MKIVILILLGLFQLIGLLYPHELNFFIEPLFIFTVIPCSVLIIFSLVKQKKSFFYITLFVLIIRMAILMLSGCKLSTTESVIGAMMVLLYINIVNSFDELELKVTSIRPILLKVLDFVLFILIFTILSFFLIIPIAQSGIVEIAGINEMWVLIISIVIFALFILFINVILSIKSVD